MESGRKQASEALKRAQKHAYAMAKQAVNILEATFADEPAKAQDWGFIVRQTGRSAGRILLPKSRDELLATLNIYIDQEESRPEAERFTLPALADMTTARDDLNHYLRTRDENRRSRKRANADRRRLSAETRKMLNEAAAYLVLTQCDGQICPELEKWGFIVEERRTPSAQKAAEEAETVSEGSPVAEMA